MPENQPQKFLQELALLQETAQEWGRLFPQGVAISEHWQKVLAQVQAHVAEDVVRLAVVGAVKSGKSTALNALVGQDLLKRGAGILTAIITRVQPGEPSRAVLRFKEWEAINGEIRRALGMLPNPRLLERTAPLDLRQTEDRELLTQVLAEAQEADLWREGSLDQNYLLLRSYLQGYDLIQNLYPPDGVMTLTGPDLARHKDLVTQEATAVYLNDVLLTVPFSLAAAGVELGDCQGSDSPIPQHLGQVLAYLIKSDLALYVVSSRVGLRQADFQFLAELARMGLAPHMLTLLNLDLGEHASVQEVMRTRDRVKGELAPWQAEPRLYAFSALKLLLDRRQAKGETLGPRETAFLSVWATDPESAALSTQEAGRFEEDLQAALRQLRHRRLAGGSLAQVRMVARGMREQMELTRDLLAKGVEAVRDLESRLENRRQPLRATLATLSQTMEGAGNRLKKTLRARIDTLLDLYSGQVGAHLRQFIQDFEPDWDRLVPPEAALSFRPALYLLFQEFARALAQFVTSEANITLVEFIRSQEEWLRQELVRLWEPLILALQEALSLYYRDMAELGLPASPPTLEMAGALRPEGLEVPLLNLEMVPDWRFTREVWLRSGMGFMGRTWEKIKQRLGRGDGADPRRQLLRDLQRALAALKGWLPEEVRVQVLDYRERLKFRYFLPLVDAWLARQQADLEDSLGSLVGGLEGAAAAMHLEEEERLARSRRLAEMIPQVAAIEARLTASSGAD